MDPKNFRRQSDLFSHAAKRRRVEAASHTLSKPFRSPLKTASKPQKDLDCGASAGSATPSVGSGEKQLARPLVDRHIQFGPSTAQTPQSRRQSRANFSNEPTLYPLLKEERQLERELRELKLELDTVEQARQIETKEEDEELAGLIEKWKGAARVAAEEVFGKVSDRINRMGGPAAWREMQKDRGRWDNGGFDEAGRANDIGHDHDGREDRYHDYDIEPDGLKGADEEAPDEDVSHHLWINTYLHDGVSVTL